MIKKLINKNLRVCFLIFLLSLGFPSYSQIEDNDYVLQSWLDYNYNYALNPEIDLLGMGAIRSIFPGTPWWRIIARPGIRYIKNDIFDFYGGLDVRHTFLNNKPDVSEFRPMQGVRAHWPNFKNFSIQQFLRLEERFQFPGNGLDFTFRIKHH